MKTLIAGIALASACAALPATAGQLDSLKGMMGGGGSLTSASKGNAAGILQYCVTNNYLGGDSGASGVKDQLLGKLGTHAGSDGADGIPTGDVQNRSAPKPTEGSSAAAPTQDKGYLDGAKGLLRTSGGKTLDLGSAGAGAGAGGAGDVKAQLTRKVCDAVLKQGKGMLGMGK